jgi:hypothetical protein
MDMFLNVLSQIPCLSFCCYCKKAVKLNGKWIYLDEYYAKEVLLLRDLSHGCCSLCYVKVKAEIAELKTKLRG